MQLLVLHPLLITLASASTFTVGKPLEDEKARVIGYPTYADCLARTDPIDSYPDNRNGDGGGVDPGKTSECLDITLFLFYYVREADAYVALLLLAGSRLF